MSPRSRQYPSGLATSIATTDFPHCNIWEIHKATITEFIGEVDALYDSCQKEIFLEPHFWFGLVWFFFCGLGFFLIWFTIIVYDPE